MNIIGQSIRDLKEYKGKKVFLAAYTTPEHCLFASEQYDELIVKVKDDIIQYICDDTFKEETV